MAYHSNDQSCLDDKQQLQLEWLRYKYVRYTHRSLIFIMEYHAAAFE